MAISEAARNDLYNGLRDVLGPDRTETLMTGFALHELDVVATKADIAELRAEMSEVRSEIKADIAGLRVEMAELRAELKADMAQLQRTMIGWMVSLFTATVASVIGVALLG